MSLKDNILRRAIRDLKTVGVEFRIRDDNGNEYGDLVLPEAPRAERNDYTRTGYRELVGRMQPGDEIAFNCAALEIVGDKARDGFQSSVGLYATRMFGIANSETSREGDLVLLVRHRPNEPLTPNPKPSLDVPEQLPLT